jgi:hypothetical protein
VGNRKKMRSWFKPKKDDKVQCPECGGTDFDHMKNLGFKNGMMYDGIACRTCPWSGAVPAHKIRVVN